MKTKKSSYDNLNKKELGVLEELKKTLRYHYHDNNKC